MMQATMEDATPTLLAVNQVDARRAAIDYVADQIDSSFEVVDGAQYYSKPLSRKVWRFFVRCEHGPLGAIYVDAHTGDVIPLTGNAIRVIREKAEIMAARKQGRAPVNEQGFVLGEYARRQASGYLDDQISMFYGGADPIFVPGDPPVWQVTIVFKMYDQGPFALGLMDVDARTGEPIPLAPEHIKRIQERTCAIIRHQTPASTEG
jgi:hypothetical protein